MRKLRTAYGVEQREELTRAIEQAVFCAYGYPSNSANSKKSKSKTLIDHSVTAVNMTWDRILLLAEFLLPAAKDLPEFDTVNTCTAEQEALLKKIAILIPSELDPKNRLEDIQDFIQVNGFDKQRLLDSFLFLS